jgi:hypothetical protein
MMDDLSRGGSSERATGTPNTIYNLSSVLFHALEGGASYDTYIEDAEREGDEELVDFFSRVRDEDSMRADEAQRLLAERTPTTTTTTGTGVEPAGGATTPSEGLAAGAPRREETATGRVAGQPDMDVAPTGTVAGAGRVEPDVPPRTEPSLSREGMEEVPPSRTAGIEEGALPRREEAPPREGAVTGDVPGDVPPRTEVDAPLGGEDVREPQREREEDRGLLDRAKDAILGEEEEPRRREGSDRPDQRYRKRVINAVSVERAGLLMTPPSAYVLES